MCHVPRYRDRFMLWGYIMVADSPELASFLMRTNFIVKRMVLSCLCLVVLAEAKERMLVRR